MKKFRYLIGAIIIVSFFICSALGRNDLNPIVFSIFFVFCILYAIFEIFEIRSTKKMNGIIINYEDKKDMDVEINQKRYSIGIRMSDGELNGKIVHVYAVLYKEPIIGDAVKIMIKDGNIDSATYFKGDEIIEKILGIVVFGLILFFGILYYFMFIKGS